MRHVFIVGAKGIPSNYGGYETFVDKLTEYHQYNPNLKYHVACKSDKKGEFEYHNARCFQIKVPQIGSVQAIYYDVAALYQLFIYWLVVSDRSQHTSREKFISQVEKSMLIRMDMNG